MLRLLAVCFLALLCEGASADTPVWLESSRKAMAHADSTSNTSKQTPDQIPRTSPEDALKQSRKVLSELNTSPPVTPSMPKLDLFNIQTPSFDINLLARQGHDLMGRVDQQTTRYETQVLVFVSSSMPEQTVKSYLHQTQAINAALVFRGLVNDSMKDMQQYLAEILGQQVTAQNPTVLIDPTLFERFKIQQVPTTVVTESEIRPCQSTGCPIPVYHRVSGDVSLAWSLALIARQIESAPLKATLKPLIKDLEQL